MARITTRRSKAPSARALRELPDDALTELLSESRQVIEGLPEQPTAEEIAHAEEVHAQLRGVQAERAMEPLGRRRSTRRAEPHPFAVAPAMAGTAGSAVLTLPSVGSAPVGSQVPNKPKRSTTPSEVASGGARDASPS